MREKTVGVNGSTVPVNNDTRKKAQSTIPVGSGDSGKDICDKMKDIDFWCKEEKRDRFCCSMHVAGLPRHPATKEEMLPTPYQLKFVEAVIKAVTNPGSMSEKDWKRPP